MASPRRKVLGTSHLFGAAFLLAVPHKQPTRFSALSRLRPHLDIVEARLKFLLPSDARYLALIRAAVRELASVSGLADEECCAMTLAVDEAVANVIRHAYRGSSCGTIEIDCRAAADRLEFTLLDAGDPPDPARIRANPLDDSALSGRGTHLIRMIMDEVCYERVPRGNQLRLSKRLLAPKAV